MRVGDVRYTSISPGKWRFNWHEEKRIQQTVQGLSAKDARDIAHDLNEQLQRRKLGLGGAGGAPSLRDGFTLAKAHSRARLRHLKNRDCDITLFLKWLNKYDAEIKTWADLRPQHIHAYQRHLESEGKSFWRIKGRMEPISQAWHAVHANHPTSVLAPPRFNMRGLKAPRHKPDCLTASEVRAVLEWLAAHAPDVYPIAALQSLAGLRMLEAASLRVSDLDGEARAIRIDDTEVHQLKNQPSHRTIPVGPSLWAILEPAWTAAKTAKREYLFVGHRGKCLTNVIVKRWARALAHLAAAPETIRREGTGKRLTLNPHGLARPELARVPASKLRVSFATMLIGRADRDLVKLYMGHSAGDVLGQHYEVSSANVLRPVADAVEKIWCNETAMRKARRVA